MVLGILTFTILLLNFLNFWCLKCWMPERLEVKWLWDGMWKCRVFQKHIIILYDSMGTEVRNINFVGHIAQHTRACNREQSSGHFAQTSEESSNSE